jgi:integration host factor subunit alpha
MTITKAHISAELVNSLGLSRSDTKKIVDLFFDTISATLCAGEEVHISGFGNFVLKDKRARPGRNPRTSEEVLVEERRVVTFKSGQKLKTKIKHYAGRK